MSEPTTSKDFDISNHIRDERCLGQCRFVMLSAHRRRLQQAWEILTYRNGTLVERIVEWRGVPTVD